MIKITGVVNQDRLKGVDPRRKKRLMRQYARFIVFKLRSYTPVRTGELKRGWKIKIMDTKFIIKNEVSYGVYYDKGIKKALDRSKGKMSQRAIREATRKFTKEERGYLRNLLTITKEY